MIGQDHLISERTTRRLAADHNRSYPPPLAKGRQRATGYLYGRGMKFKTVVLFILVALAAAGLATISTDAANSANLGLTAQHYHVYLPTQITCMATNSPGRVVPQFKSDHGCRSDDYLVASAFLKQPARLKFCFEGPVEKPAANRPSDRVCQHVPRSWTHSGLITQVHGVQLPAPATGFYSYRFTIYVNGHIAGQHVVRVRQ